MLARGNEERPQAEQPAGVKSTTFDEVQANGGITGQAVPAVVSELPMPPYPAMIGKKPNKAGGFKFELDIDRMHQSDTWAITEKRQRPFLVMVWIESWTQVPCGTLPDDDTVIAARIGMPLPEFKASKEVLMRGWWKANDGRLYHPVITEQVTAMVAKKARHAEVQANSRKKKREGATTDSEEPETDGEVTDHCDVTDTEVTDHNGVTDRTYHIPHTTYSLEKDQKQEQKHLHESADSRRLQGDRDGNVSMEASPGISILLKGGGEYTVTGTEVAEWASAYPGQDVISELRKVRAWSIANPTKRKTKVGMPSHINGWLARNANAPPGKPSKTMHTGFDNHDYSKDEAAWNS